MYGKVFESMYEGTLYGHWEAIVTMQQLIVLATPDGVVEMTPPAIAARTSIPLEIIEKGLKFLAEPDPYTRTPGEDGRRIVLLEDSRPWGWRLVNHWKYRGMRNMAQKREADRKRIEEKRSENRDVATSRQPSPAVASGRHQSPHSDSDSQTDSKAVKDTVGRDAPDVRTLRRQAIEILKFLNEKTGRNYQPVKVNVDLIVQRLKQGATDEECRQIIAKKAREWKGDEKMDLYLRPATLFGNKLFWQYHGELVAK